MRDEEEDQFLLEQLEALRRRDGWSMTELLKQACIEYADKHFPGNPGLPLDHWTKDLPFSEAANEKLQPPQSKPAPDYSSMTDEHLLERYNSPFTDGFEKHKIVMVLRDHRGFNVEDLRRDKRLRRPQ